VVGGGGGGILKGLVKGTNGGKKRETGVRERASHSP